MYGCESWTIKKAEHQRIDAFEPCDVGKDSWNPNPLDSMEIKPVNSKRNQTWTFIGRTNAEAETPILWPPDAKNWLIWKDPDAGKAGGERDDRGWDSWMASPTWWTWVWVSSGSGDRQGSLVCCSQWGHSQSWLSEWTELNLICTNNNGRWIVDLQWKQKVWTRKKRVYL